MTSVWQGKRIALAAGGTGGHVYPALAVLHELKEQDPPPEIWFMGRPYGLEHDLMTRENVNYIHLTLQGLPRKPCLRWLTAPLLTLFAFLKCLWTFIGKRPHLVIGFGSYVAAPVVLAALCLRIPTLIHEQNSFPGAANRHLAPWVHTVLVSYPDTPALLRRPDAEVVGIPLRKEVLKQNTECALPELQSHLKTLLIFGGSQGARKICRSAIEALPLLENDLEGWQTLLIAGPKNYELIHSQELPKNLILKDYIESMGAIYQVSHLVVSRAGAVSLAEITAHGLPAVSDSPGYRDRRPSGKKRTGFKR